MSGASAGLSYAEDTLGVHTVYEEAVAFQEALKTFLKELDELKSQKRNMTRLLDDRKMDLISDHRAKHPEQSQAAFDNHMKTVFHRDDSIAQCKLEISVIESSLDRKGSEVHLAEQNLKILIARMEELGGYLHYLGVLKASASNKPASQTQE